jgi:DNA-binding transcriptional LysR family regulator
VVIRFPSVQNDSPEWNDLRVLLALHRHGSFLRAGQALRISVSTASRRIDALESALGRIVVRRGSTGTSIEPDAIELVALAEQLENGLSAVGRDGKATSPAISGVVRISAGEGFVPALTQVLVEIHRLHQALGFEVVSEARMVDLSRREADIGIRTARSSSPALIEKPVGTLRFGLYASRSYIERRLRGNRLLANEIPRHDFVGFDGSMRQLPQERWLTASGATRFPFRSNSQASQHVAALGGRGICLLPEPLGQAIEGLERVDVDRALPSIPVFLVFHRDLRRVPRIRVVVGTLQSALRRALA